jgi:hypothetical protein
MKGRAVRAWVASSAVAPRWVLAMALAACTTPQPASECPDGGECADQAEPPRLYISPPFGLGFDCVELGCDRTAKLLLSNHGGGTVRITRLLLTSASSPDFRVDLPGELPLELGARVSVEVGVRYQPTDAVPDQGVIRVVYSLDPAQGPEPEPIQMALRTRSLGPAHAQLELEELNFGFVSPGDSVAKEVVVKNVALQNSVLAVTAAQFSPESDSAFSVLTPLPVHANAGQSVRISVRLRTPLQVDAARTYTGVLHLETNDGANPDLAQRLIGTGRQSPMFTLEPPVPAGVLDLGSIGVGGNMELTLTVRNVGGSPLLVNPVLLGARNSGFVTEPASGQLPPVPPFDRTTMLVRYTALAGGTAMGEGGTQPVLRLETNDPDNLRYDLRLRGFGVLPHAQPSVSRVDFGATVVGWEVPARTVLLRNTGAGPLNVNAADLELGTSAQIVRDDLGAFPVVLLPEDPPLEVTLRYRPAILGTAQGALIFATDDPEIPVHRVPITARAITCEEGCPLPHATPRCDTGACSVGSCVGPWHDADRLASDGCECAEDPGGDLGNCAQGVKYFGTLPDDGSSDAFTGTLHDVDDTDTFWFYAKDEGGAGQLFGDDFDVRIELVNTPAGVEMCIRQATHDTQGQGCGRGEEVCGKRSHSKGGSYGSDDDTDFTIKVRLTPGTAPFCATYTVRVKNG